MQYNGQGPGLNSSPTVPDYLQDRGMGAYNHAASNMYAKAPLRTGSSDTGRPSWRSVSYGAGPQHSGFHESDNRQTTSASPVPFYRGDVVARHLLVETALLDSQNFELLPIEEVDALKKEKIQLDTRLEATRRRLALESKVRDAAQSLHRLYTDSDAPRSPDLTKKSRRSILGDKPRSVSGSQAPSRPLNQAGNELATSTKKVDELLQILAGLESRRQYVESRILRHTAAVLQEAHNDETAASQHQLHNDGADGHTAPAAYTANSAIRRSRGFDDELFMEDHYQGFKSSLEATQEDDERGLPNAPHGPSQEQITQIQSRLEDLNAQMHRLITQARANRSDRNRSSSDDLQNADSLDDDDDDVVSRLANQLELMDKRVSLLDQELDAIKGAQSHVAEETKHTIDAIEGRLESVNHQVFSLLTTTDLPELSDLEAPPEASGHDAQAQMNYLEESILSLEQALDQVQSRLSREVADSQRTVKEHADNLSEHETVLGGLWSILTSNDDADTKEAFTLRGFSAKVQHLFERATFSDQQADILRRQIQQQRELNNKSDGEKDQQLSDLQASHANLEQDLVAVRAQHASADNEAESARAEMDSVMKEVENLKEAAANHAEQKQQVLGELDEHKGRSRAMESSIADYEAQISEHGTTVEGLSKDLADAHTAREGAETSFAQKRDEMAALEAEVVRLTMDLTMSKAQLDEAYGSRAERAKEVALNPEIQAQLSRVDELHQGNESMRAELDQLREARDGHGREVQSWKDRHAAAEARSVSLEQEMAVVQEQQQQQQTPQDHERTSALEKELAEMAAEYQELTSESVAIEKDREQLEALVDGLRERCEALEAQLSDERVRWLGIKSPTASVIGEPGREATSTMVLRTEFKKMMRETRAEGVRLLRAEQEERRKLEGLVRSLRRDNGGGKNGITSR